MLTRFFGITKKFISKEVENGREPAKKAKSIDFLLGIIPKKPTKAGKKMNFSNNWWENEYF